MSLPSPAAAVVAALLLLAGPASAEDFGQEVPSATPGNPGKVFQTGEDPTADEYGVPSATASGVRPGAAAPAPAPAPVAPPAATGSAASRTPAAAGTAAAAPPALRLTAPSTGAAEPAARSTGQDSGTAVFPLIVLAAIAGALGAAVAGRRYRRTRPA